MIAVLIVFAVIFAVVFILSIAVLAGGQSGSSFAASPLLLSMLGVFTCILEILKLSGG